MLKTINVCDLFDVDFGGYTNFAIFAGDRDGNA